MLKVGTVLCFDQFQSISVKQIDFILQMYIKSIRDQKFKGETPSSDFVTSSITNICYCVKYVLYLTYSNEICSMFFIYPTCYLKTILKKNHDYYFH